MKECSGGFETCQISVSTSRKDAMQNDASEGEWSFLSYILPRWHNLVLFAIPESIHKKAKHTLRISHGRAHPMDQLRSTSVCVQGMAPSKAIKNIR